MPIRPKNSHRSRLVSHQTATLTTNDGRGNRKFGTAGSIGICGHPGTQIFPSAAHLSAHSGRREPADGGHGGGHRTRLVSHQTATLATNDGRGNRNFNTAVSMGLCGHPGTQTVALEVRYSAHSGQTEAGRHSQKAAQKISFCRLRNQHRRCLATKQKCSMAA